MRSEGFSPKSSISHIGTIDRSHPVTIIGAGVSGLLSGHWLDKLGISIQILESSPRVGGKIESLRTPYGIIEKAANAILNAPAVEELADDLELQIIKAPKLKKRVFDRGHARAFPLTLIEALGIFYRKVCHKKIPEKFWKPEQDIHLACFFEPFLGPRVSNEILSAGLRGIYASSAKEISLSGFLGTQFVSSFLQNHKPGHASYSQFIDSYRKYTKERFGGYKTQSISFKGGMQDLTDALFKRLKNKINLETPFTPTEKTPTDKSSSGHQKQNLLICTDAFQASVILKDLGIPNRLDQINYASVSSTTLILKQPLPNLEKSFGVVFPPQFSEQVMGIVCNHEVFSARNYPYYSYTIISKHSDKFNLELLLSFLNQTFNIEIEQTLIREHLVETFQWQRAIPIYNHVREEILNEIRDELIKRNICLFSNYTGKIGLRDLIHDSKVFSQNPSSPGI